MESLRIVDAEVPRTVDRARAERAVTELLIALGEDPGREGLEDTPRRVAKMFGELMRGLDEDPGDYLARTFAESRNDPVILRDIELRSLCEHHLLPFVGRAHVAYLPTDRVVGLSKLARTVHAFARRPQVQERLTGQIADAIMEHLAPRGALVVVEANHMCMKLRGVQEPRSEMITVAARGLLRHDNGMRRELLDLIKQR